eukprot:m.244649 g.244649  ORF g.244649 m.244649 type:complete len:626 (-) comp33833_c3_seq1:424-2301(-)
MGKKAPKVKKVKSPTDNVKFNTGSRINAQKSTKQKQTSTLPRRNSVGMPGQNVRAGAISAEMTPPKAPPKAGGIGRNTRKTSMYGRKNNNDVIQGVEDISKAAWYVGRINRIECDKAVLVANPGDWLVRMSSNGSTYVICVNDNGQCQNFQVHIRGKKYNMGGVDFNSVMECLMFLKNNPINGRSGRLYYLGKPAQEMKWYVGAMEKTECDKMVLAAGKSDYLVRLASDNKNYVLCINQGNGKCKNCKVFTEGGVFTLGPTSEKSMEELLDTLQSVPIPTNDGKSNLYLRKPAAKADYYAGQMLRAECEEYVKKAANGDFLIRQNTRGDKYVLVVNDSKHILNFIISQTPDGKFEFGGLPHDSLEMVIRYLKKAPLASKTGGQLFISRPARMTNADDMIADVEFGFADDDVEEEEEERPAEPRRRALTRGGNKNPPAFASSDEEEEEEEDDEDNEELYDSATVERFDPFRVSAIREITGVCKEGEGIFVISKNDVDNTYTGVYKGEQVTVPIDAVEKASERKVEVVKVEEEEEEDDEDDEDFGNFEEDEDAIAERKAAQEAERERIKEESRMRMEQAEKETEEMAKASSNEAAELARQAAEMEAKLKALEESDEEGFGDASDEDE